MLKRVVIVGGAGGSKVALDIFDLIGIDVAGFMNNYTKNDEWGMIEPNLLGSAQEEHNVQLLRQDDVGYFVATGDNTERENITTYLQALTRKAPINAIHPTAVVSRFSSMGSGNLICAKAIIGPCVTIGNGTIINNGAVIDHDNIIDDYAQISPNASISAYGHIGTRSFISIGASVIPQIRIGEDALVAAGAAVIKDVEKSTLVAGCPAEFKKTISIIPLKTFD